MHYQPDPTRYDQFTYNRCGHSGLLLPPFSLGLWHNFGGVDVFSVSRAIILRAFDRGITHFDLANNYGPPYGSAEENFGRILKKDLHGYRDELVISTKAGYDMWPGPYGINGSRKYLLASLDQSLKRMGLEYVDIFYSHRPDPETPVEETMGALDTAVKQGKALYAGISNYSPEQTRRASEVLEQLGTPCLIHQPRYNMFVRDIEEGLLPVLKEKGIGCIPFSPLAQGLLTDKYLDGIPPQSRAGKKHGHLQKEQVTPERVDKIRKLNDLAQKRGQTLAQLALAWIHRHQEVTSVLIGASSLEQLDSNLQTLEHMELSPEELEIIETILK